MGFTRTSTGTYNIRWSEATQRQGQPVDLRGDFWQDLGVAFGCSWIVAFLAQVSIPLPFSPIPLAMGPHTLLAFLSRFSLRRGVLLAGCYLLEGSLGLPVFACPPYGVAAWLSPRGGYLMGCLVAACVLGRLERWSFFGRMCIGTLILYVCGICGLCVFMDIQSALWVGVFPFVVTDVIKMAFWDLLQKHALPEIH